MNEEQIPRRLQVDFRRSASFRVVHADGVWGGVTPYGKVYMTFFSETPPLPEAMAYSLSADGTVQEEVRADRRGSTNPSREVEVGVVMDLNIARSFLKWLAEKIDWIEKAQREMAGKESSDAGSAT